MALVGDQEVERVRHVPADEVRERDACWPAAVGLPERRPAVGADVSPPRELREVEREPLLIEHRLPAARTAGAPCDVTAFVTDDTATGGVRTAQHRGRP